MKPLFLAPALALALTLPAIAQETPAPETDDGFSLIEEGAKLLLRGMMSEMEPALDEMGDALRQAQPYLEDLGPQFTALLDMMGDIRHYEQPVVLDNGDILIRRKAGAPPYKADPAPQPETPGPNGEVEL
jgi:hypothetical protein